MTAKENGINRAILIVEDDPGIQELETQRLEPLGFEVLHSYTHDEARKLLGKNSPALMLLDYSLAGMNALELLEDLRRGSVPIPPFILVTGRGDERVAVDSMKAGALDYIVKDGAFLENLLPAVRKALEKAELQRRLQKSEADLRKNLRLYNFLAQVNQAAAREKTKEKLYSAICSVAVEAGGFKMAWIGEPDQDIGRVVSRASSGLVDGYLASVKEKLDSEPAQRGPTATALLSGRIVCVPDITNYSAKWPWREEAVRRGYRSLAAIPLTENGRPAAVLNLYSGDLDFFSSDEQKLMTEIAGDISLALDAISSGESSAAAQATLARTSSELSHLLATNPVALFRMRSIGGNPIIEWVSGNVQGLLGYDNREVLAPGWIREVVLAEDSERMPKSASALLTEAPAQDFRVRRKDGSHVWIHGQFKALSGEEFICSWTDITNLKESEKRFQEMFMEAPSGYQALDEKGCLLAVNNTWCRTFGRADKDVLGRSFSEFVAPQSRGHLDVCFRRFKETGAVTGAELDILRPDGAIRRISFDGRVSKNPDGSFRQTHCVFTDVTDTWRAREQTDLLGQAVKNSFNEVYIFDASDFHFIFANYGALKNLGYREEEMESMTPWDLKKEYTAASFRARVAPLLEGKSSGLLFESVHSRKDGTSYPVEVRLQLVETGKKRVFLAVVNDITERKKSEKMMQEIAAMQRVESLGLLAGGIAHDFNNMLTGIMANVSLLAKRCGGDPENDEILREALEAAKSAQSLTSNLLAFSKGGKPVKKEFCLQKALWDIFKLATSGTSASCEFRAGEDIWSVEGDENQLKQAFNNLLINGLQAMPSGGRLSLEAVNVADGEVLPDTLEKKKYVKITVSDTGIGIPEQYLEKLFDPYFTTKSKGHGLGLSMVWSVVKNHSGHIEVSSVPGKGSAFVVYLPATGRSMKYRDEEKAEVVKGSGRILVLEDEEVVSGAIRRMLKELGYSCEVVSDGREAVRRYAEEEKAGRPFSAVIMDLTIPGGIGGAAAVLELREICPGAKVIVSSGYSDQAVMADYKASGFDAMLPKPYRFEELSEVLCRLLTK